jgi:hypothetical protein
VELKSDDGTVMKTHNKVPPIEQKEVDTMTTEKEVEEK